MAQKVGGRLPLFYVQALSPFGKTQKEKYFNELSLSSASLGIEKGSSFDKNDFSKILLRVLEYLEPVAQTALKRMQDVLRPGHTFNVGASGDASRNLMIEKVSIGGTLSYAVTEGDITKANRMIRWGFKGPSAGKRIPEENIRLWMAQKRITGSVAKELKSRGKSTAATYYGNRGKDGRLQQSRYFLSRSKKGKAYGRAEKKSAGDVALNAIIAKLSIHGSSTSHWTELYPKGAGRFDYPSYVVNKNRSSFNKSVDNIGFLGLRMVVEYLLSGRAAKFGKSSMGVDFGKL